jgi:CDP-diacylglycerol--serine O-phosphatidyltransferase
MSILRLLKFADIFTIGNLCSGVLSSFFSAKGSFGLGAAMLFAAVIFDLIDGKIAAVMKQQNDFGKQLDSLADLVSFGVAPVMLYFCLVKPGALGILALLFFVVCGMLRLARYNISKAKGFIGIPITSNGIIFPLLYVLYLLSMNTVFIWPLVFVLMGLLMVSGIKVGRLL